MVTIVYDGSPGGGLGNLFDGVKFWVAQRVPMRQDIVHKIQSNGGIIVPLERQADTLIADHARKDVPPGSYSWKFVKESVDHGMLQSKEKYAISSARRPDEPRPVASGAIKKLSRTPFTADEDAALTKYVLACSVDAAGNQIYQDWAKSHPRHPWQSWRDRWVKQLRTRPRESLEALAASAPVEAAAAEEEEEEEEEAPAPSTPQEETIQATGVRSSPRGVTRHSPATSQSVLARPQNSVQQQGDAHPLPQKSEMSKGVPSKQQISTPAKSASRCRPMSSSPSVAADSPIEDSQQRAMRGQFYSDLKDYIMITRNTIELQPRIGGKGVELFDLHLAVSKQEGKIENTNWLRVAQDVGFERSARPLVAEKLQKCYRETLLRFLRAAEDTNPEMDSNKGQEEDSDEEEDVFETAPAAHTDYHPPSPPRVSVSPVLPQLQAKRPRDEIHVERPTQGSKRRRLVTDDEIPSTPPGKIASIRHRRATGQALHKASRQDHAGHEGRGPPQLPAEESTVDITPTQQLRYENLRTQPHPIRSQDQQPPSAEPHSSARRVESAPRRSLPSSFNQNAEEARGLGPVEIAPIPSSSKRSTHDPSSSLRKEKPKSNHELISYWVEHYESLGYSHKIVLEGLKRTTMTPGGLASMVMQSLQDGQGIPSRHEGIWTNRDDQGLRMIDGINPNKQPFDAEEQKAIRKAKRDSDRLINKHGLDAIELRRQFLNAAEAVKSSQDGPSQY